MNKKNLNMVLLGRIPLGKIPLARKAKLKRTITTIKNGLKALEKEVKK